MIIEMFGPIERERRTIRENSRENRIKKRNERKIEKKIEKLNKTEFESKDYFWNS